MEIVELVIEFTPELSEAALHVGRHRIDRGNKIGFAAPARSWAGQCDRRFKYSGCTMRIDEAEDRDHGRGVLAARIMKVLHKATVVDLVDQFPRCCPGLVRPVAGIRA